jgi:threonyl-tRNA synthetase
VIFNVSEFIDFEDEPQRTVLLTSRFFLKPEAAKAHMHIRSRQIMIVPISVVSSEYALRVKKACRAGGFHVDCDQSDRKMQKKVRARL